MQILYVIGMLAVSVLCLALLSTARRILRSSPLSNNQFGASRMYQVERPEEESLEEFRSTRAVITEIESAEFELEEVPIEPVKTSSIVTETVPAKAAVAEPVIFAPMAAEISTPTEEPVLAENAWGPRWARIPKPSRQTYNYALECALLGISAWVLIKTQRSTLQQKPAVAASQNRVA